MNTEDDTYRILSRESFNAVIARQAAHYGIEVDSFYQSLESRIIGGASPSSDWQAWWPGWTFNEVIQEVVRRKENDNR